MLVQSSFNKARTRFSRLLNDLVFRTDADEALALDMVEEIAGRLHDADAYQIRVIGYYVRANIALYRNRLLPLPTLLDRFTHTYVHARLGHQALTETLVVKP